MEAFQLGRYLGRRQELASVLEQSESLAAAAPSFLAVVAELAGCEAAALWSPGDRGAMSLTASWGEAPAAGWPERLEQPFEAGLPGGLNGLMVGPASHPLAFAAFANGGEKGCSAEQEALLLA